MVHKKTTYNSKKDQNKLPNISHAEGKRRQKNALNELTVQSDTKASLQVSEVNQNVR